MTDNSVRRKRVLDEIGAGVEQDLNHINQQLCHQPRDDPEFGSDQTYRLMRE